MPISTFLGALIFSFLTLDDRCDDDGGDDAWKTNQARMSVVDAL